MSVAAGGPTRGKAGLPTGSVTGKPTGDSPRIPGAFQLLLALYIILTGDFPTLVQALAFGLEGGGGAEFAAAMVTSLARDLLLLMPVLILASHPLGILHPLLLAVIVWPLLVAMPKTIEQFGGWGGVLVGLPVDTPFFTGFPSRDAATVWTAIAKYNGLQILALVSTYFGFWIFRGRRDFSRVPPAMHNPLAVRPVLIGLFALSIFVFGVYVYFNRGGVVEHLTSLGRGRFRELAGDGPIMVITDLSAIVLFLWIAARPGDAKSPLFLGALAVAIFAQFVSNGSRGSALMAILFIGIIWSVRRQRVPWKLALILVPFMFVSLGLLGAVRTSSWSGSTAGEAWSSTGWAESVEVAQKEMAERRSQTAQIPIIERGFEVSGGPMLGQTYMAALGAWIPRAIWEDKPRGPGALYAQMFLNESSEGSAIPVSPEIEMYWNFGLPGLLLLSVIYGALLRLVYHFLWRRYPDPFAIVFYVIFLTTFAFGTRQFVRLEQQLPLLFLCYVAVALLVPKTRQVGGLLHNRVAAPAGRVLSPQRS